MPRTSASGPSLQPQNLYEKLKEAKRYFVILVIALVALSLTNYFLYFGLVRVPSSATYLENFDNMASVKKWDSFKEEYLSLDPNRVESRGVSVAVNAMDWLEELVHPKGVVAVHVNVQVSLGKNYLKYPSILILILDQKDNIRGKLYIQYGSEDSFLSGEEQREYVFFFKVSSDMQGEKYTAIVEVFGKIDYDKETNYMELTNTIYRDHDVVYGLVPKWHYEGINSLRSIEFFAYDIKDFRTPPSLFEYMVNVPSLSFVVAGLLSTSFVLIILARNRLKKFVGEKIPNLKIYVGFAVLFFFFFILLLILITLSR